MNQPAKPSGRSIDQASALVEGIREQHQNGITNGELPKVVERVALALDEAFAEGQECERLMRRLEQVRRP